MRNLGALPTWESGGRVGSKPWAGPGKTPVSEDSWQEGEQEGETSAGGSRMGTRELPLSLHFHGPGATQLPIPGSLEPVEIHRSLLVVDKPFCPRHI